MCGIFGVTDLNDLTEGIIPYLAYEMEDRGRDSWGITDGNHVYKRMGHITENFMVPDWSQLIGHCRAASVGQVRLENQHPFHFEKPNGGYLLGIHNGTLSNHSELNKKYDRDFSCDSMHIFANLAEEKGLEDIRGSAAIAFYDENLDLHLGRFNSTNLELCQLDTDEWVFASSMAIRKAIRAGGGSIRKFVNLDKDKIYRYNRDENKFEPVLETSFAEPKYSTGPWTSAHHSEYIYTGRSKDDEKETKVIGNVQPTLIRKLKDKEEENDEFEFKQCEICECWTEANNWPICDDCLASFNSKLISDTDTGCGLESVNDWIDCYVMKISA